MSPEESLFLEEPLTFLTDRPLHLMSDEELRAQVDQWRNRRKSVQTNKAIMLAEAEAAVEKVRKPRKAAQPSAADDYLASL